MPSISSQSNATNLQLDAMLRKAATSNHSGITVDNFEVPTSGSGTKLLSNNERLDYINKNGLQEVFQYDPNGNESVTITNAQGNTQQFFVTNQDGKKTYSESKISTTMQDGQPGINGATIRGTQAQQDLAGYQDTLKQ